MKQQKIIKIHSKSDFNNILQSKPNGIWRNVIFNAKPISKLEKIIFLSKIIQEHVCKKIFIETKYSYGSRNKRFEIVFEKNNKIYICKISNPIKFDKDSMDLDYVITDIADNFKLKQKCIIGLIFIEGVYTQKMISSFEKNLKNNFLFLPFEISSLTNTLKNGIFN